MYIYMYMYICTCTCCCIHVCILSDTAYNVTRKPANIHVHVQCTCTIIRALFSVPLVRLGAPLL